MYILEKIENIKNRPESERKKIAFFVFFVSVTIIISVWSFGINRTKANSDISLTNQGATVLPTSPFEVVEVNLGRIFDAFKNIISR